jgi:hypothetical protein
LVKFAAKVALKVAPDLIENQPKQQYIYSSSRVFSRVALFSAAHTVSQVETGTNFSTVTFDSGMFFH